MLKTEKFIQELNYLPTPQITNPFLYIHNLHARNLMLSKHMQHIAAHLSNSNNVIDIIILH